MSIEAIVFDFGNVICSFHKDLFLEKLVPYCDKSVAQLHKLIFCDTDVCIRFECGRISDDDYYKEIVKMCGLTVGKSEFFDAHTNIFTPITETFELIKSLKSKYKLGLLSNTSELDFNRVIKPVEVFGLFDAVTLSFEVGAMKPDKKIYDDMIKKIKMPPQKCVYIDDVKEFTDAGKSFGFNAINYQGNPESLVEELQKLKIRF